MLAFAYGQPSPFSTPYLEDLSQEELKKLNENPMLLQHLDLRNSYTIEHFLQKNIDTITNDKLLSFIFANEDNIQINDEKLLEQLVQRDGNIIKSVRSDKINDQIIDLAFNHGLVVNISKPYTELYRNPHFIKRTCEIDGNNIKFFESSRITPEIAKTAFDHGLVLNGDIAFRNEFYLGQGIGQTRERNPLGASPNLMRVACEIDPNNIRYCAKEILTEKFVKDVFKHNPNMDEIFDYSSDYISTIEANLGGSKIFMQAACEMDGNNIRYCNSSETLEEVLDTAVKNGLVFNRELVQRGRTAVSSISIFEKSERFMIEACKQDPSLLMAMDDKALTEKICETALTNGLNLGNHIIHQQRFMSLLQNSTFVSAMAKANPNDIKYAYKEAITPEICDRIFSDDRLQLDFSFFCYTQGKEGAAASPLFMTRAIQKDPYNLRYCKKEIITDELITDAFDRGLIVSPSLFSNYAIGISSAGGELDRSPIFLKKVLDKNLPCIGYFYPEAFTNEILDEIFEVRKIKFTDEFFSDDADQIRANSKFMKRVCEQDGNMIKHCLGVALTDEIIDAAFQSGVVINKDLFNERNALAENGYFMEKACELDRGNFTFARGDLVTKENFFAFLPDMAPSAFHLEFFQFEPEIVDAILTEVKKNRFNAEQLVEMIRFPLNQERINSDLYKETTSRICNQLGLDKDRFDYIIYSAIKTNDEILTTLNFKLLDPKYEALYYNNTTGHKENPYDKLYALAVYPDIQEKIIRVGEQEFGKEKIELLSRILKRATIDSKGQETPEWQVYYERIIDSFATNEQLYSNLSSRIQEIDDQVVDNIIENAVGQHNFNITTFEEMRDFNITRSQVPKVLTMNKEDYIHLKQAEWDKRYQDTLENNLVWVSANQFDKKTTFEKWYLEDLKSSILERNLGISYKTAEDLCVPFYEGIQNSPPGSFSPEIVELVTQLHQIINEDDDTILRNIAASESSSVMNASESLKVKSYIKKTFLDSYNEMFFKVNENKVIDQLEGSSIVLAGGKDGTEPFNMMFHALGAYSGFDPYVPGFDYKEDWDRPKRESHGVCTSIIGSNNLGTARASYACLGFTDIEPGALLLGGPNDLFSTYANLQFNVSKYDNEKSCYIYGKGLCDWTRHTHNEVVVERIVENKKRAPSYIVLDCETYDDVLKKYQQNKANGRYDDVVNNPPSPWEEGDQVYHAIKASKDFSTKGEPLPIVVIERQKIAIHERNKIAENYSDFMASSTMTKDQAKEYFSQILMQFENNYVGSTYSPDIQKAFFPTTIQEKDETTMNFTDNLKTAQGQEKTRLNMYLSELSKTTTLEEMLVGVESKFNELIRQDETMAIAFAQALDEFTTLEEKKYQKEPSDNFKRIEDLNQKISKTVEKVSQLKQSQYIKYLFNGTLDNENCQIEYNNYLKHRISVLQNSVTETKEQISIDAVKELAKAIGTIDREQLFKGREETAHSRKHIETVLLFATLVGEKELPFADLPLLLASATFYESKYELHNTDVEASAKFALEKMQNQFDEESLKIIQATILYQDIHPKAEQKGNLNENLLAEIFQHVGLDFSNQELLERTEKIIYCLKDADALDRTRFTSTVGGRDEVNRAFVNPELLHFDLSKSLVLLGEQLNEYYSFREIDEIIERDPSQLSVLGDAIQKYGSPKVALREYRYGRLEPFQEIKTTVVQETPIVQEKPIAFLDEPINDDTYLTEYNSYLQGIYPNQLTLSQVKETFTEEQRQEVNRALQLMSDENLYEGRDATAHSRKHVEDVVLFSTIVGGKELPKEDLSLLLTAAAYHDAGRVNDHNVSHAKTSSILAQEHLAEKYDKTDLQIIRAAIEYHEERERLTASGEIDPRPLDNICANLGMDTSNQELMERTRKIAYCLKDADALDRTRFTVMYDENTFNRNFVDYNRLHSDTSRQLIMLGEQLNEYHAVKEINKVAREDTNLGETLVRLAEQYSSPKMAIRAYHKGKIQQASEMEETPSFGK